ncbi:tRNA (cytidine(56)-2'-O)-methyltransferase [uncultured archaeon]|nr:tRNA (cytidine(56)-2'-O)-methyltransferase [uncultured archaeon]
MTKITVLRIGHRKNRDKRITTHCGLVARAFGADKIIICGEEDECVNTINKASKAWGGKFEAKYAKDFVKPLKKLKKTNKIVHLTFFGTPIQTAIKKIRKEKNILIVIGAEKVPRIVYNLADYNVAVTNQPHSEVAALAIMLDKFFSGKELNKKFTSAKKKIIPSKNGKNFKKKTYL